MTARNDEDRRLWVLNDQELYNWWKASGQGIGTFIRANRKELNKAIAAKLDAQPTPERGT